MSEFSYSVDPDFDYTIDEKGNAFIALRKIDWGNKGAYKLDLRKYYATDDGERMQKGVSFLTEDGPDELAKVLIENGIGDDDEISNAIIEKRPGVLGRIYKAVSNNPELIEGLDDEDYGEEEIYYDPEELIS